MDTSLLLSLLTAFGLGSIVTAIIQSVLQSRWKLKERSLLEKREAYIGLLDAYHKAAVHPSDENSKNFAYWQMRCELVAPWKVRVAIEKIIETNENPLSRHKAHDELKDALREDLRVTK